MAKLNEKALLVQLRISHWAGRKFDRKATKEVADLNGVATTAGRYNKALMPATDVLNNIHAKTTHIRNIFYKNTLPWGIEGTMMLPTANYMDFTASMRKEKQEWCGLVAQFLQEYPTLILEAQKSLGKMFNEADYPPVESMVYKFAMDVAVFPVPSTDFRVEVGQEALDEIKTDIQARLEQASSSALQEAWKRLYDPISKMADKLADPSAVFRDSLVGNVNELCELMGKMNFTEDAELDKMRKEVKEKLASHHPDNLRLDPDLRRDTASEAKAIMERMKQFMGGD